MNEEYDRGSEESPQAQGGFFSDEIEEHSAFELDDIQDEDNSNVKN